MVLGIIALCQPWNFFLHPYGVTSPARPDRFQVHRQDRPQAGRPRRPTSGTGASLTQIELRGVQKYFGAVQVIKDLNLTIDDNEFIVLLGQSGCGKTTTLRAIAGLETIDEGDILIDGKPVQHLEGLRPRHRHGVPVLLALPAHERLREHRLPAEGDAHEHGRGRQGGARDRQDAAHHRPARPRSRRRCRAATCSAWRSAGRWCGGQRRC